jgi:hypothetical protein
MMGPADRTPSALGKRFKPIGDIDYVIMSSANDEDRLAELLASFQDEYPEVERGTAIDRLRVRLEHLRSDGKVGDSNYWGRYYGGGRKHECGREDD